MWKREHFLLRAAGPNKLSACVRACACASVLTPTDPGSPQSLSWNARPKYTEAREGFSLLWPWNRIKKEQSLVRSSLKGPAPVGSVHSTELFKATVVHALTLPFPFSPLGVSGRVPRRRHGGTALLLAQLGERDDGQVSPLSLLKNTLPRIIITRNPALESSWRRPCELRTQSPRVQRESYGRDYS